MNKLNRVLFGLTVLPLSISISACSKEKEEEIAEEKLEDLTPTTPSVIQYTLVDVKGTRGNLVARIKSLVTNEVTTVKVGDNLNGEVITAVTSEKVVVDKDGTEYVIKFSN